MAHFWPPVITANKFIGGGMARVTCSGVAMTGFQDFKADLEVIWEI